MKKALKWFPLALLLLFIDYWKYALVGVAAATVLALVVLLLAGVPGALKLSLLIGLGGAAVAAILWVGSAAYLSWGARNSTWRMF